MQTLPLLSDSSSHVSSSTTRLLQANLLVGLLYLALAALVSLAFSGAAPIWPATAAAMFAALAGGWRWLPGIAFGSWLGNDFFMQWDSGWALWITLGNILGALFASVVQRRFAPDVNVLLESGRGVTLFGALALASSLISASLGALAPTNGLQPSTPYNEAFFPWIVSDFTATLMLTPALLLWWRDLRTPCQLLRGNQEMWLAATTLVMVTLILFFGSAKDASSLLRPAIFLTLLPLVWVALRFPQRSTFTLLSLVFFLSLFGTWMEKGVIAELALPYTRLQIILISMGMITLLVSSMSMERRRALDELSISHTTLEDRVQERTLQLRDNLQHLERLLDNVPIPMVIARPDQSIVIYANLAAADYSGYSLARMVGSSCMMYFHTLEDFKTLEQALHEKGSLNSHEVVLRHRSGRPLWALVSAVPSRYNDTPVMMFALQDISSAKRRELDLEQLVSTDALTQTATRRHFMQRGDEMLRSAERSAHSLCLLILDLDHFKSINDNYGHPVGDQVLRRVAEAFRSSLRSGDLCGRLGGEEFGVILGDADHDAAHAGAERLRQVVGALDITVDGHRHIRPTVSIGAVLLLPSDMELPTGPSLDEAISSADQALYRAKNGGRNRVVFAPPLVFRIAAPTIASSAENNE